MNYKILVSVLLATMAIVAASLGEPADKPSGNPASRNSRVPLVMVTTGSKTQELQMKNTQLAETKTKPTSLTKLAEDAAVTRGLQAGMNAATWEVASHMHSVMGSSTAEEVRGIFSSAIRAHRQPKVTYVWGVSCIRSGFAKRAPGHADLHG